ncbi:hypothetical protein JKP88DRAFT_246683 [Tribonema minus]|uniref:Uncharacterized protein n=1 Tax=Tribonema minus TaxID=303371 RepID=A0A836CCD5_9STRA|nr:hypothetical protein JKP88DRAFT_246683 [Tribonema minus]
MCIWLHVGLAYAVDQYRPVQQFFCGSQLDLTRVGAELAASFDVFTDFAVWECPRQMVMDHVANHSDCFRAYLLSGKISKHIKRGRKLGTHAGEIELRATEELLDRPVLVYRIGKADMQPDVQAQEGCEGVEPIQLGYHLMRANVWGNEALTDFVWLLAVELQKTVQHACRMALRTVQRLCVLNRQSANSPAVVGAECALLVCDCVRQFRCASGWHHRSFEYRG